MQMLARNRYMLIFAGVENILLIVFIPTVTQLNAKLITALSLCRLLITNVLAEKTFLYVQLRHSLTTLLTCWRLDCTLILEASWSKKRL